MKKLSLITVSLLTATSAYGENVTITGNVQSKCVINTDTLGVYGNPTADKLTTAAADGGVMPVVRYDVSLADAYTARISYPDSFSSSPSLNDVVNWSGSVSVKEGSDAGMSAYDTTAVTYDNTYEFDLSIAGSTWFKVESSAEYGYGKALPSGQYTAIVQAECIAN